MEKDHFYHNPDHLIMIGSKSWERKVCYSHIFSVNLLPVQSLNNTALISTVVWFCRCLHCCCCMCHPPFVINRSANHSWFWKEIDPEIYLVNPLQRIRFSLNRFLAGVQSPREMLPILTFEIFLPLRWRYLSLVARVSLFPICMSVHLSINLSVILNPFKHLSCYCMVCKTPFCSSNLPC